MRCFGPLRDNEPALFYPRADLPVRRIDDELASILDVLAGDGLDVEVLAIATAGPSGWYSSRRETINASRSRSATSASMTRQRDRLLPFSGAHR
jgi:hypothetical protein